MSRSPSSAASAAALVNRILISGTAFAHWSDHAVKAVLLAALTVALAARPADACRNGPCPPLLRGIGYTFAAGLVGGYAVGTGTFIHHDLTRDDQSLGYGVTEATLNGLAATAFAAGVYDSAKQGKVGQTIVLSGFTALHGTLAVHGTWCAIEARGEIQPPKYSLAWLAGSAYGINTLAWAAQIPNRHGRGYGIEEAAVNAPIAIGLGYLACDRFASYRGGPGLLYGGMAAVSGALAIHGVRTAISPPHPPTSDFLEIMPSFVPDGDSVSLGLSASGTCTTTREAVEEECRHADAIKFLRPPVHAGVDPARGMRQDHRGQ